MGGRGRSTWTKVSYFSCIVASSYRKYIWKASQWQQFSSSETVMNDRDVTIKSTSRPAMSDLIKLSLPRHFSGKRAIHIMLTEPKRCGWQTWMLTCHVALKLTYEEISFHLSLSYVFWVKSVFGLLTYQNSMIHSVLNLLL